MKLNKEIREMLSSPDSNVLSVEDSLVFLSPGHSSGVYLALKVRHKQTGLRYVQLVHLSYGVAHDLGESLIAHAEMAQPHEPEL